MTSFSRILNSKLQSKDCLGNTIKFPRLQKGKYYVIGNKVVKYFGITEKDLMSFQDLKGIWLYMTRRNIKGIYIEKLGDKENIYKGYDEKSIDIFSNGKTLMQVLEEIKTREYFI